MTEPTIPSCLDMAMKRYPRFDGSPSSNATEWAKNMRFLMDIYQVEQPERIRVIATATTDKALSWVRDSITNNRFATAEELIAGIECRFDSRLRVSIAAQQLASDGVPQTAEKYFELLEHAETLHSAGYYSIVAILDRLLERSPSEIRSLLWGLVGRITTVFDITKAVEEAIPIAYKANGAIIQDPTVLNRVSSPATSHPVYQPDTRPAYPRRKYCAFHKSNWHDTKECREARRRNLRNKEYTVKRTTCEDSDPELIKQVQPYTVFSSIGFTTPVAPNPFIIKLIDPVNSQALLDTGADISLIPRTLVPRTMMIQPTTLRAIAANALPIQTDGEISNLCLQSTLGPIFIHRALIASGGCMAIIAASDIINNPALAKATSAQLLNTSSPSQNARQFSFPSQNSRHTSFPSQNSRHTSFPSQNSRHTSFPSQNSRHTSFPSQNSRHTSFPPRNTRHTSFPPRNTRHTSFPQQDMRHTSLPTIASTETICQNQKHATPNAPRVDHSVPVSIRDLVLRHTSLFQTEISHLSLCKAGEHAIETFSSKPITCPTTRVPVHWEKDVEADIAKHLRLGIIRESSSPWNSRIVPVKKKDGSIRLCIDYRPLNKITIGDRYPVPRIDEILDTLADASVFSTLDATSGYFQLALKPEDIPKTAFSWKGGHYEFTRMPFGLCNAPATFQRAMDTVFRREKWRFVIPYFDDIIIFSKSMEEHQRHLEIILTKIRAAGLSLNPRKCKFAQHEMEILGNLVSKGQVKPSPNKLTAIREYKLPATIKDLRAFLGLAGYVRGFAPNFASLAKPLTELLKGESKTSIRTIAWPEDARKAFSAIKDILSSGLKRAQPDFSKSFILTTDASEIAIGAILAQRNTNGEEVMIRCFSQVLDETQSRYSVTDRELLAVVKATEHFRHYLLGKQFTLRTDHKALSYLWDSTNMNSRLVRWALKLQDFAFTPEYIRGEDNAADGLSRPIRAVRNEAYNLTIPSVAHRSEILKEYHLISGHGSSVTLKFLISSKYSWPGMARDIEFFCTNCLTCQRAQGPRINTKNRVISVERPNQLWTCDILGRLPTTGSEKNSYLLL